jgi:hypothetical protein
MADSKRASVQFIKDFDTVAGHFKLAELGELDQAKQCARNDMANAEISFSAMAQKIRNGEAI